ncbi:MAG TPA: ABC transporter permease, partial [Candidatus Polarisedimenticolia bacterium]|nr:ABC transporter permease [Candidatus Polarisedimenticolia bacterium]
MTMMLHDARYAIRSLRKTPGLALTAMAALALGIGGNTAIFSVVDAVLLRPMPYERPDGLLMLWQNDTNRSNPREWVSPANFLDWRKDSRTFASLAAFRDRSYDLTGSGEPERLDGQWVSASLFPTLGVQPLLGRVFRDEEDRPGAAPVALLSHRLWQRRFGSDPAIVGKPIALNGQSVTVVGIMPAGFRFPGSEDELWMPLAFDDQMASLRHSLMLRVVGRLAPGATPAQARAEMDTIGVRLAKAYPDANTGMGITLVPLQEEMVGNVRTALLILLGAVAFVLLIACANVANLLLSRAAARKKEMAIRASLGAGRARLLRQLLTESILLSLAGGAVGAILALWGVDVLQAFIPADVPRFRPITVDARVLLFTLGVSLLTGLLFGVLPALDSSRLDLNEALRDGTRGTPGRARGRARDFLVVGEIGVALVLLIGAGLLVRSFGQVRAVDPGFVPDRVLTLKMGIPKAKYGEPAKRLAFYHQLLDRVSTLPGVRSSGVISFLPLTFAGGSYSYTIDGRIPPPSGQEEFAVYRVVSPGFLAALGVPLRGGRGFTEQDGDRAPQVAIISDSLARRDFPGEDPIGRRLALGVGRPEDELRLIVGVVGDVRQFDLEGDPRPAIYVPYAQEPEFWLAPHDLVVR